MKKPSTMFWAGMGYAFVLFLVHIPCGGEWPHARCFVNPDWDVSRFVQETLYGKVVLFPYWLLDVFGEFFRARLWMTVGSIVSLLLTLLITGAIFALVTMFLHRLVRSRKQI